MIGVSRIIILLKFIEDISWFLLVLMDKQLKLNQNVIFNDIFDVLY